VVDTVSADVPLMGEPPAPLSKAAHYVERIRRSDQNTLDYQVTVDDPVALKQPWTLKFQYHRIPNLTQLSYADCVGNERNPVVDGKFTIAPP
jgi:hypothetical protein